MSKEFFNNLLRSIGRVPEDDLKDMRAKKMEERRYIRLKGEGDIEELSDDYFEDGDVEYFNIKDDEKKSHPKKEKRERDVGDLYFFSLLFIVVTVIVGMIAFIARAVAYPFLKKLADDFDF